MFELLIQNYYVQKQFRDFKKSFGDDWPRITLDLKEIYGNDWQAVIKHAMSMVERDTGLILDD